MWKKVEALAAGEITLGDYTSKLIELEEKQPIAVRHLIGFKDTPPATFAQTKSACASATTACRF
jgi:hypothetical protein